MGGATIRFTDLDSGGDALAIVRPVPGGVGLALSHLADGDAETYPDVAGARLILAALDGTAPAAVTYVDRDTGAPAAVAVHAVAGGVRVTITHPDDELSASLDTATAGAVAEALRGLLG